jgi:glycosyltransferase involved in cell wall biosynthesis
VTGLLVHDWIEKIGGSERVLLQLHQLYPAADVLTLWSNNSELISEGQLYETALRRAPMIGRKALALPIMPIVWRHTIARHRDYDWIIASSHSLAHQVRGKQGVTKLVYAHTPARYLWAPELDPRGGSLAGRSLAQPLKHIDRAAAREITAVAVNSRFIQSRVERAWRRDSTVIYPPVRVSYIQSRSFWGEAVSDQDATVLRSLPGDFLLGASRFISYKRLELVIRAGEVVGVPVVLAGAGPEEKRLRARAADASIPVAFVRRPSDPLLFALYERAVAFVFPAIEDFGLMPVEAAAAGCPVVVNEVGGAAESVIAGMTGSIVDFGSPADIKSGLEQAGGCSRSAAQQHAARFSEQAFRRRFSSWASNYLREEALTA